MTDKAREIFDIIIQMANLINAEHKRTCTKLGILPVHVQILDYLSRCNRYSDSPAALTSFLGMTKGTVSQSLLLLEKKGLVMKIIDASDKRKVHLKLTQKGVNILQQVLPMELNSQATKLIQLDDETSDKKVFMKYLKALQQANQYETFGLCKTCKYCTKTGDGFLCGLTREILTAVDIEKICREHTLLPGD